MCLIILIPYKRQLKQAEQKHVNIHFYIQESQVVPKSSKGNHRRQLKQSYMDQLSRSMKEDVPGNYGLIQARLCQF